MLDAGPANALRLDLKDNGGEAGKVQAFLNQVNDFVLQGILDDDEAAEFLRHFGNILLLSVTRQVARQSIELRSHALRRNTRLLAALPPSFVSEINHTLYSEVADPARDFCMLESHFGTNGRREAERPEIERQPLPAAGPIAADGAGDDHRPSPSTSAPACPSPACPARSSPMPRRPIVPPAF